MADNDYIKKLLNNIKDTPQSDSSLASNSDLDKIKAKHGKHMVTLTNLYEFWTHKTIIMIIAIVMILTFLTSRYLLVAFPESKILKLLNTDSKIVMSYFATAVASWFITKNLDN